MPLSSSRIAQKQTNPRATHQPERTGTAQHHRPKVTSTALATRNPRARSLLIRLLTKRAGAKTSYNLVVYSSMECAPWARISKKNTSRVLCSTTRHANARVAEEQQFAIPQTHAVTVSLHPLDRRDDDAPAHDHGPANGHCRGPRGPNALRASPSLPDSGRSADVSSMPLQREDAPNFPEPSCNGDPPVSNILRSKRSPRREAVRALHKRSLVAGSRCKPKSALNLAR
jgi:hypothetical protein